MPAYVYEVDHHADADAPQRVLELNALDEPPVCWHCPAPATVLIDYRGYGWGKGMEITATTCAAHSDELGFWLEPWAQLADLRAGAWVVT